MKTTVSHRLEIPYKGMTIVTHYEWKNREVVHYLNFLANNFTQKEFLQRVWGVGHTICQYAEEEMSKIES